MLRREVLCFARPDGRWDVWDPIMDRVLVVDDPEAAGGLWQEGPAAEHLRLSVWRSRQRVLEGSWPVVGEWERALYLPGTVAPAWREPERWRRLAEARVRRARLDAFYVGAVSAPATARFETALVRAFRGQDASLEGLFADEHLRHLLGACFAVDTQGAVVGSRWTMGPGDHMGVHPDGRDYALTFSLGLSAQGSADDGGTISFVDLEGAVTERWWPYFGDLLVFVPGQLHGVEPLLRGQRESWTGWYAR